MQDNFHRQALAQHYGSSNVALLYWDIRSDEIILSARARQLLGMSTKSHVDNMASFMAYVPPACLPSLNELREGLISGSQGSRVEIIYPCQSRRIRETMLALERDKAGRAVAALAHFELLPDAEEQNPAQSVREPGLWVCTLPQMRVRFNAAAANMLCVQGNAELDPALWKMRLHPEDAAAMERQLKLVAEEPGMGGRLEMVVRHRIVDEYVRMHVTGSVMETSADGKPSLLWGSVLPLDGAKRSNDLGQHESHRLLFAVNSTGDGLWDWDSITNKVYFSPRYLSMLGYTAEEFPGDLEVWAKKIHPDDHDKIIYPQRDIVESPRFGDTFECTYRLLRKDGTWAWILGRGYVTSRNEQGRATRIVGMHTDITNVQNEREKLEDMVKNDTLTGLRSRSFCNLEMERIDKNGIRPVCVISVDVTGLKMINDYLGHATGDKLLSTVAILLREPMRATDCVARMGGDEFIVLLPGCSEARANTILQNLQACFDRYTADKKDLPIRVAFGMAYTEDAGMNIPTLLRLADEHMLRNKAASHHEDLCYIQSWIEQKSHTRINFRDCRLPTPNLGA